MAYKLQDSAPELMNLASESQETLQMYGIKDPKEANFARNCLLARRLVERGVRFVQPSTKHGTSTAISKMMSREMPKPPIKLAQR